jgi:hypothetical protein
MDHTHVFSEQPSGRLVVVDAARSEAPLGCRTGDGERAAGEGGSEQSGGHGYTGFDEEGLEGAARVAAEDREVLSRGKRRGGEERAIEDECPEARRGG